MNLVLVPFHDWKKCEREGFRTRDAHWMQEFGNNPSLDKLLIVNRPTSLAEVLLLRRTWRTKAGKVLIQNKEYSLKQVSAKTYVLDIFVSDLIRPLQMKRHWIPYIFGEAQIGYIVQRAIEELKMNNEFSMMISAPIYVPLVKQLNPSMFALDAQDNLLKHSLYSDTPQLAEYYSFCQANADLITTNSKETADWLGKNRKNVKCIPNGVDTEVFRPLPEVHTPADLKRLSHPIVGYAGKMQEMFDVSLMAYVVSALPHVNFVFIGQQLNQKWMRPLWNFPNTYYLGDKHYHLLNQYLASFDICIIPYDSKRQHGGDPIKFYEYLAMGKPVVTTNIGNVASFAEFPQVAIATNQEEFLQGLQRFLSQIEQGATIEKRTIPESALWRTKAQEIFNTIGVKAHN